MLLAQEALLREGVLKPILFHNKRFPSLTNPSIINISGRLLVNVRNVDYVIYSSLKNKFEHWDGPMVYVHTDSKNVLETENIIVELNPETLEVTNTAIVDTTSFDTTPEWNFIGLEDARMINWHNKLSHCGVRRDTETTGIGRMQISELCPESFKELSRQRIPTTPPDNSYCEKNWMPILDKPYHFVKWCNPVEIVEYNPTTNSTSTVHLGRSIPNLTPLPMRGGSQVIPFDDGYLAVIHETELFRSEFKRKEAVYRHRFIYFDKNWSITKKSQKFSFMEAIIEFCCGMCEFEDYLLLSFGYMDNGSYILKIKKDYVRELLR